MPGVTKTIEGTVAMMPVHRTTPGEAVVTHRRQEPRSGRGDQLPDRRTPPRDVRRGGAVRTGW